MISEDEIEMFSINPKLGYVGALFKKRNCFLYKHPQYRKGNLVVFEVLGRQVLAQLTYITAEKTTGEDGSPCIEYNVQGNLVT